MGQHAIAAEWQSIAARHADSDEPGTLDPARYDAERRAFVRAWQQHGWNAAVAIYPEALAELARADPTTDPTARFAGSSWEDLAAQIAPLSWAWDQWLLRGMLTMIVAEQQMGKSLVALRIAACYLRGDPWPDGTRFAGPPDGKLLWCEAESSQGLNLRRAQDWGLPIDRILSPLDDPLDDLLLQDPDHIERVESFALRPDVALVVVDSLSGANQARENDSSMMHVVKRLADIARDTGKPVILTHHLRKRSLTDSDRITLDRIRGSGAIVQPARVVWALDQPDANSDTRRLSVLKNNISPASGIPAIGVDITDSGLVFGDAPEEPRQETLKEKAADMLLSLLRKGPRRSTDLQAEIEGAGLSWYAAKRAKKALGVVAMRQDGVWFWGLPANDDESPRLPYRE